MLERPIQGESLSVPQYRFLLSLKRGAKRSSQLAESAGISRPTASALVDDLVGKGIIRKLDDPTDRRATMIKLTKSGLMAYADFEARLASELASYFPEGWPPSVLDTVEDMAYLIDERSTKTKNS